MTTIKQEHEICKDYIANADGALSQAVKGEFGALANQIFEYYELDVTRQQVEMAFNELVETDPFIKAEVKLYQ